MDLSLKTVPRLNLSVAKDEPFHESKEIVCRRLGDLLRATNSEHELVHAHYKKEDGEEYAVLTYKSGRTLKVNISGDSGIAIIMDVMKKVY